MKINVHLQQQKVTNIGLLLFPLSKGEIYRGNRVEYVFGMHKALGSIPNALPPQKKYSKTLYLEVTALMRVKSYIGPDCLS